MCAVPCRACRAVLQQITHLLNQYSMYLPSRSMTTKHDAFAGDAVVLQRWTDDRFKLHMHIIKDASDSVVASAVTTTIKGKGKHGTASTTQRRTKVKLPSNPVPTCCQDPKPYSPGSLEALHDAALLCANTPFPNPSTDPHRQFMAPSIQSADCSGRSTVSAAAVAAADAAAVQQQGLRPAVAADMTVQHAITEQDSVQYRADAACLTSAADNDADHKDS